MHSRIDARLREEAERFRLRFACPDCVYFDEERQRCSEGYPSEQHRDRELARSELVFCKLFEGA